MHGHSHVNIVMTKEYIRSKHWDIFTCYCRKKKYIDAGSIEIYLPVIVVKKNIHAASIGIYLPVDQTGFLHSARSYSLVPYTG